MTETWLNASVGAPSLHGYEIGTRRDRNDGRTGGGVILFAAIGKSDVITTILIAPVAERFWCVFHSSFGHIVLCGWYRPPERGEVASIETFIENYSRLQDKVVSTIIFGDLNIHQIRWLEYSRGNTPEGFLVQSIAGRNGFE